MKDQTKTKQALIQELSSLKHRIQELERAESERKRVEEALHESETKLQAIFDTVGTGIIIIDRDTQIIIEANQTAVEMTGLPKERIIGQICHSLVCPAQAGKCPVKDLGQSVDNSERKLIHADGHLKDILKTVYPVTIRGRGCYLESFIDITDRKQAEEALRESEKKYRNILESIQEGYFELDLAGNYTFVNKANCIFLGYTEEELVGMNFRQHTDEETAKKLYQPYYELYRTGKSIETLEVESIRKDGTKVIYETAVSLIRDSEGKPIGFRGVSRDITERKRAEETLQKSEERYRTILEDIDEGYFEIDLAGNFTFVNDAECRDLGYSHEGLIGMNYRQYSDEATAKNLYELFYNIYNTGKPVKRFPGQFMSKDGRRHFNEVSASLIRDAKGKPIGFRGVSRDISEHREMEEAIRKSEEKYRTIIEQMEEGYFELDLAGNFTFVNDAECRNLEYSRDELIGMNNRQYQDETTAQKMNQLFRRLYRTGEPVKALDVEIIRKTGTKGFNEVSISLIRDAESKPIGFRGISRDITERKRAEDALRESEKRYHELSIVDDLTQLYNSRHFYFQLKSELDRSNRYEQPLTLLLLDLDNFKAFNDAYGHVEGDQVLRQLGQVVKRCLRETDFACRYGGEEFTIILPMTTSADGAVTAERIRAEFKKENFSPDPGKDVNMTVSIGVAQYRTREDMKAFVHRVDQLMYQGKTNGKDRVCSES